MKIFITESLKELLPVLFFSSLGGTVRLINNRGKISWTLYFAGILTAVFAGLIVHYFLKDFEISENFKIVAVALSAYVSRDFLEIISERFIRKVKIQLDEN